jgi:hypothetical protein
MTIDFNYTAWYVWGVQVGCISAERQTCLEPKFLHAKPSKFHDQELEQVTTELNEILGKVAASSNGRGDLSILLTPDGLLLAWTQPSDTGTVLDDRDEIRKFLGYTF